MNPTVTFVVPCYKLGHLLKECVDSILGQTYADLEVLIMDDCSPDQTAEVARSFQDSRVRHIRNEPNLGHLTNYNKGIRMARGKYVWLISADDRLRSSLALKKYVRTMERHPSAGYVFCPAIALESGRETRVVHSHGRKDKIMDGRRFLSGLLSGNSVVAASGMARKECYDAVSYFPADMPWGGDWYLWCVFALHYDVAYLAEPFVNYRTHDLSMTNILTHSDPQVCAKDDLILHWRVKEKARDAGCQLLVQRCRHMIAYEYAHRVAPARDACVYDSIEPSPSEQPLLDMADDPEDARLIRARLHACWGDLLFCKSDLSAAANHYSIALRLDPRMHRVRIKRLLLPLGSVGIHCRQGLLGSRRRGAV